MLELRFTIYDGALRSLCIDHDWCTGMAIEEYGELLDNSGDLTLETMKHWYARRWMRTMSCSGPI